MRRTGTVKHLAEELLTTRRTDPLAFVMSVSASALGSRLSFPNSRKAGVRLRIRIRLVQIYTSVRKM